MANDNFRAEYFNVWQDAWNFHRLSVGISTEAEWDKFLDTHNELCIKYENNRFAKDLLLCVVAEIQRKETAKWQAERINNNL
jgi:hypothetical protein